MSISDLRARLARSAVALTAVCGLVAVSVDCGPSEECLRLSDCDEGLTCSNGRCSGGADLLTAALDAGTADGAPRATASSAEGGAAKGRDASGEAATDATAVDPSDGSPGD